VRRPSGLGLLAVVVLGAGCVEGPASRRAATAAASPLATSAPVTTAAAPVQRIDVDVVDVDLADVMEGIGRKVGRNILVDPEVQERVTISLGDIAWREAVDVIARRTHVEVEEREGGILVLSQRPVIDVRAWDLPVRGYLELLSMVSNKNVIISPELLQGPPVCAALDGWSVDELLDAEARALGADVVVESGDLVRIVPRPGSVHPTGPPAPAVTITCGALEQRGPEGIRLRLATTEGDGERVDIRLDRPGPEREALALLAPGTPTRVALARLEDGRLVGVIAVRARR
jgi:type II secretory pathway component GspD/PulD (secretin)